MTEPEENDMTARQIDLEENIKEMQADELIKELYPINGYLERRQNPTTQTHEYRVGLTFGGGAWFTLDTLIHTLKEILNK